MDKPTNATLDPGTGYVEEEEGSNKTKKLLIYGGGLLVIVGLLIWAIVGTATGSLCGSDLDSCNSEKGEKQHIIQSLNKRIDTLSDTVAALTAENKLLKQEKKELESIVDMQFDEITKLRSQVSQKEVEVERYKAQLKVQDETIRQLNRKIEVQADQIKELSDATDEYYSDLRMIVGILNQELNRNQALQREIESLEAKLTECTNRVAVQDKEILALKEQLFDANKNRRMSWLHQQLIQHFTSTELKVTPIYKGTQSDCNSEDFYTRFKDLKPNMFIATERHSDLMFGGVTTQSWETAEGLWKNDPYAFTFSLTNETVCKLTNPDHALFTGRTNGTQKVLLTFGEDISIADKCIAEFNHNIVPNKVYQCPKIEGRENYYTRDAHPHLDSFVFYRVEAVSSK